jgi:hypothetical protein
MFRGWLIPGAIFVIAGLLGAVVVQAVQRLASNSSWQEIAWPFPRDAWQPGRAFRCTASTCGDGVELYVRPKIGFCNCTTGIVDDIEVDRVTDLDLISERFTPVENGQEVSFAGMQGRARHYTLQMPDGMVRTAVGLAVARRCDVTVAVIQGKVVVTPGILRAALNLLSSNSLATWLNAALNGS